MAGVSVVMAGVSVVMPGVSVVMDAMIRLSFRRLNSDLLRLVG
jgi:hypothetical protein